MVQVVEKNLPAALVVQQLMNLISLMPYVLMEVCVQVLQPIAFDAACLA